MESVGFKEWALVCEALGRGEQSIILRKGGMAEGRAGFAFRSNEFFLFPTLFHEQVEKLRTAGHEIAPQRAGEIEIKFVAKLESSRVVTSWEMAVALDPFHILRREVVRERFDYDAAPGIHLAFVRVFRLEPSWTFPDEPRFGGCRSWLQLPAAPTDLRFVPVLSDAEHAQRTEQLERI